MMQLKQTTNEKHKSISNLQTSGANLKQKILDLSAKRTALLAELEEVEIALAHALMSSRPFSKKGTSKLAKPWP
jgi:hypothetical protein